MWVFFEGGCSFFTFRAPALAVTLHEMFIRLVKIWICASAWASVAGWTLSAMGMLNKTGYVLFAFISVLLFYFGRRAFGPAVGDSGGTGKKVSLRFRRFLPGSFAFLALLVFAGGVLYAPGHYDGLCYRVPRVLQWLAHGNWFWIYGPNYRMNDRACGLEWLSTPLLLFFKTDRLLFLLNFIPFLLLPGLIFSVWTRLGVRPRVAWNWMWIAPTGYCFLIQAGGIANDAFPTVYGLAMIDFALRAREKLRGFRSLDSTSWTADMGWSLLSAALLTGAKASNIPLGLPWAILFFPLVPKLFLEAPSRRMLRVAGWSLLVVAAILVSFLPIAVMNIHYLHDWSGLSVEDQGMDMKSPIVGLVGNTILLVIGNFAPTFFPMAGWWNAHASSLLPSALVRLMDSNFEFGYLKVGEMPTEDWAGIGFGISVLVAVALLAQLKIKSGVQSGHRRFPRVLQNAVLIASWVSLLAFMAKSGMVTPTRLIAPYYPLLLAGLLASWKQERVVRSRWWRVFVIGAVVLAFAALVMAPARPLWPARTLLAKAAAAHPGQQQLVRAEKVYEVYGNRPDPLAGVRQWFPPGVDVIGFLGTGNDLDISLWKPYGSRRVEQFFFGDSREEIRKHGIEYAVVGGFCLNQRQMTIQDWLQKSGAELIATTNVAMAVGQGPQPWYLVRIKP